jgi:hypothetical protein
MSNNYSFNPILQPAVASTIQPLSANNLLFGQSGETSDIIGWGYDFFGRVRPLVDKSCCNQGSTGNPY